MEIGDLPTVFEIGEQTFTSDYSNIYRTWTEYEVTWAFSSDGELCLVATVNNRVVGFAIGTFIEKGTAWNYGHLLWLGIKPRYQNKGVGTALMKEMKKRFRRYGARIMLVDTQRENASAISFFKKHGFIDESEHVYLACNLERRKKRKRS